MPTNHSDSAPDQPDDQVEVVGVSSDVDATGIIASCPGPSATYVTDKGIKGWPLGPHLVPEPGSPDDPRDTYVLDDAWVPPGLAAKLGWLQIK